MQTLTRKTVIYANLYKEGSSVHLILLAGRSQISGMKDQIHLELVTLRAASAYHLFWQAYRSYILAGLPGRLIKGPSILMSFSGPLMKLRMKTLVLVKVNKLMARMRPWMYWKINHLVVD